MRNFVFCDSRASLEFGVLMRQNRAANDKRLPFFGKRLHSPTDYHYATETSCCQAKKLIQQNTFLAATFYGKL